MEMKNQNAITPQIGGGEGDTKVNRQKLKEEVGEGEDLQGNLVEAGREDDPGTKCCKPLLN